MSQEKVIRGFQEGSVYLNLAEFSAKYFGILFMCASYSERGEKKSLPEKRVFTFVLHQGTLTWPNYLNDNLCL